MSAPCPFGASDCCPLSPPPAEECGFYSPLKRQCMMSSLYEDDEIEGYWWDCYFRRRKIVEIEWSIDDFNESMGKCRALKKGWLDGDGEEISEAVCQMAVKETEARFRSCPPHVFPTPEGGLSLEWGFRTALDCQVNPDFSGFMLYRESGREMDWNDPASWEEVQRLWKELTEAEEAK